MKKKVMISVGPIPGKLDSVKYITNRFKGGLALKTAKALKAAGMSVTVVAWYHTDLGDWDGDKCLVNDVFEYYKLIEGYTGLGHQRFDAYIMAAAVANLVPKEPWEGKFPSHDYNVGDEINIPFTIAPRSIDIIKKNHPRSTLIGYKLFDGDRDELIRAARHTLKESNANIVFANTPKDAKTKKIALTQSGAEIDMDFDEHVRFIIKAIDSRYYSTIVEHMPHRFDEHEISPYTLTNPFWGERAIECFQRANKHGSLSILRKDDRHRGSMMISGRGHKGVPTVFSVSDPDDSDLRVVASGKASANAPLVWHFMKDRDYDIVLHEHSFRNVPQYVYQFPGTAEETRIPRNLGDVNAFNIESHGYVMGYKLVGMDWNKYYELYPHRFFKVPDFIYKALADETGDSILDIGCNKRPVKRATHVLEPGVIVPGYEDKNLSWESLKEKPKFFDLITLSNSINYLNDEQIMIAKAALKPGGRLIANTFRPLSDSKMTDGGIAVFAGDTILHVLFLEDGTAMEHTFYNYPIVFWQTHGFKITPYGDNSLQLEYKKKG